MTEQLPIFHAERERQLIASMLSQPVDPTEPIMRAPKLRGAVLSLDRVYRWILWRLDLPGTLPPLAICGLNPSTADETKDDPTIRRELAFARREGRMGIIKVNLIAYRATDPDDVQTAHDRAMKVASAPHPVSGWNDPWLDRAFSLGTPVAAWGAGLWPWAAGLASYAQTAARKATGTEMLCFGTTKNGHPRHPLYLRKNAPLEPWHERAA